MSDAPLSRRARRDLEALAAERAAAAAQGELSSGLAEGTFTGENPALDSDGPAASRRDRRRLERLARPMQSWTAEEEMIATGQIPTMTPERIAEQERLAREATQRAAADAQTASSELRIPAERDLDPRQPGASSTPQAREASAEVPQVQHASPAPLEAPVAPRETVAPYSPRFELDDSEQNPEIDAPSSVQVSTGVDPAAREVEAREAEARDADATAARAKVFEELFPPGSSQAALLEQDRLARESPQSPAVPEDDEEAQRQRGIEEFRRLTEAALSSIEGKAQPQHEAPQQESVQPERGQPEPVQPEPNQPEPNQPEPNQPAPTDRYEMPAEPHTGQGFRGFGAPASPPEPQHPGVSPMPNPGALAPPTGQYSITPAPPQSQAPSEPSAPGGWAPHQNTFGETPRAASTEIPVRPMTQPQPQQTPESLEWGGHPLDAAPAAAPRDVNDFQPVQDVPRPDFSQLTNSPTPAQIPATSGQFPTTGAQPQSNTGQFPATNGQFEIDSSATGQIAPVRRLPELPPVGGAKHFKWLHLAVIGALMFLLGVVIYNVAWGQ